MSTQTLADPLATGGDPEQRHSVVRTTTPAQFWRRHRGVIALVLLVALTAFGVTFFRQRSKQGALDPDSVSQQGSRAAAQLLRDRGVRITRTRGLPEQVADTTVFVPFASQLYEAQVQSLLSPPEGVDVVLVGLTGRLDIDGVEVTASAQGAPDERDPGCGLPAAVTAGRALTGGIGYAVQPADESVQRCYAKDLPSLVEVRTGGGGTVTLLGSAEAFSNEHLDEEGNAALALGLLDRGVPVTWVMPGLAGLAPADEEQSLIDLLPDGVVLAFLQLVVAAVVAMLWRGRRLGPVVSEPLPVVVRAAEAVEGRGRLYAAAKARDRAGWSLRLGARSRLRSLLALPADTGPDALVEGAAARTRRTPGDVGRLLYGPDPADDAALVRLATDLDNLNSEVRRS